MHIISTLLGCLAFLFICLVVVSMFIQTGKEIWDWTGKDVVRVVINKTKELSVKTLDVMACTMVNAGGTLHGMKDRISR